MNNLQTDMTENYITQPMSRAAQDYVEHIIAKRCLGLPLTEEEEIALEQTKARAALLYSQR